MSKIYSRSQVNYTTQVELLGHRAEDQPDQLAYIYLIDGETEEVRITYAELNQKARTIGAALQAQGLVGKQVLLLYPPGLEYISAFWGCLYAGVVAIPAYPPDPVRLNRTLPRLQAIIADSKASAVLTTSPILSMVDFLFNQAPEIKSLDWLATDTLDISQATTWQKPLLTGESVAMLQYTSGSTSTPKGVMLTHNNLLYNLAQIHRCFGHTPNSRGVIWLPPYHDMGLIGGILQPLYGGFPVVLMSPLDFLQRPLRWLQAISRYQATTSGGPNFAYDLCIRKITPELLATLDLSSWEVAFNGAEPIRHETLERFAEVFAPCGFRKEAFYPCYGLAEATLIVSGGAKLTPWVTRTVQRKALSQNKVQISAVFDTGCQTMISCGHTLVDQQITIVHSDTCLPCRPEEIGEIWVSGPGVARGYWNQPEETAQTFGVYLANTGDGPFLRTGDLGFLQDDELFIVGRIKDVIIIRGQNHYPQDIEQTVEQSHSALRSGCVAAFSVTIQGEERVVVAQEVKPRTSETEMEKVIQTIRQAVAEKHQLQLYGLLLLQPYTIPKTSSGKIQRHAVQAAFLSNGLEVVAKSILDTPPDQGLIPPSELGFIRKALTVVHEPAARLSLLELYLQEQVARILRVAPSQIAGELPLNVLGLDSLTAIELKHEIETTLGIVLPITDLLQGETFLQLTSQVLVKLALPTADPVISPEPIQETVSEFPLSYGQQTIWFLHQLAPEKAVYNIAGAVQIQAVVDVSALHHAFRQLVQRHPSLRTAFRAPHGKPVQYIHEQIDSFLEVKDVSGWPENILNEHLHAEAYRPFTLEQAPLFRVCLFSCSANKHILLLVVHHLIADFWSLAVLVNELGIHYQAAQKGTEATLPRLAVQYADYVRWQTHLLNSPEGTKLRVYWQQQLSGQLPVLNLPTDYPRPVVQTYHGASHTLRLGPKLTQAIKAIGRLYGTTLYMTLLAAYQVLLHRYTGETDILVGSPTAGRSRAEWAGLVGYFVNPVVLRSNLTANPSFIIWLAQVKQTVLAAFDHQDYPFGLVVEHLQPERDPGRSPVFQTMFILQKSPLPDKAELTAFALGEAGIHLDVAGLPAQTVALEYRTSQFDLTLVAGEIEDDLLICFQYNSDLFKAVTIGQMAEHFRVLLEGILTQPEQKISQIPLLSVAERQQIIQEWNNTQTAYPPDLPLHQLFAIRTAQTPDAIALVFEDQQLTYYKLNQLSNQLAIYLQEQGVGPETVVGVYLERSPAMIVGLLGILKTGGAYLPLDPTHPKERVRFILQDSQISALVTEQSLITRLPEQEAHIVCLEAVWGSITHRSETETHLYCSGDNLAYMIYTSGSTGQPKGVQITHRAVANFMRAMRQRPGLTSQDILLAVTTLSFDIAGLELFLPLLEGAKVALVGTDTVANGVKLAAELTNSGATVMQATPTTWQLLLESGWLGDPQLKILCGGEPLPRQLANQLAEKCAVLWNMYGPTETTIWSAVCPIEQGDGAVFIGRPIANTQFYILDNYLNPVPIGVPGELYIGGDGLARGYGRRPALTAQRFIPDPFSHKPGDRLYRTGDMARYQPDGRIELLGRLDHQVKLRGYRIELGEIEAAINQHQDVQSAIVVPQGESSAKRRLVAYIVPDNRQSIPSVSELRRMLQEKLPEYMLPAVFMFLEAWPLTPNGKINRQALPIPKGERPHLETTYSMPQTELEGYIATIWQRVLQIQKVGIYDNFFELGGHSLLMAQIQSQLQEMLGHRDISLVEMFQYPTVHSLSKYLSQKQTVSSLDSERIKIRNTRQDLMQEQKERRRQSRLSG